MVPPQITIPGYQVSEQIYNGSRTLVYRGYRETDFLPVVIKLLKNPYPSFNELLQFRNQYAIAKNLNSPSIVQTYSLEVYQNGYALVMEDFGGISLHEWSENGKTQPSLKEFLHIAIALCNALDTLYHQRIIHKDIKPSNILINPETKQVKLIDFSIASLLPKEKQSFISLNVLEGTLAYISPEQTGRMNRGIDYRSDFYSLGVTFYELLTGQLPFTTTEPMELVYCHIAVQPPVAHNFNSDIPPIVSEIIAKLMAKNAEDRYQSALGLKYDLELCRERCQEKGNCAGFTLGERDICDRFNIPECLYGRDVEIAELLSAFNRVSEGRSELMLVAGFSGIGKTAVVNEVHKPIVRQKGYFIKGKYDQFNRNIPLSAFVQALRDLIRQLLCEDDDRLVEWQRNIKTALGENAQIVIEVIPELEQIVGRQPPVPILSGSAAQNRFNMIFQKFIQVFATQTHPLVIFLDDLQWADLASLNLMQVLMSQNEGGYLLLIGAYRNNEVSPVHPLMLILEELKKANVTVNNITLAALNLQSLNALVADTLLCGGSVAQPLSKLVYQKTKGNPFFSRQFLKALYEDGWIGFDAQLGYWQCDLAKVRSLSLTDDVVEFMAMQLQKLPPTTQNLLKLAACIGNQFDLATLAIVSEQTELDVATVLWKALQEGLVIPQNQVYKFYQNFSGVVGELSLENNEQRTFGKEHFTLSYKFLHDRVQQAAYSLIPSHEKQPIHLKIGQLLLNKIPVAKREERVFEIVGQLNMAVELITQLTERETLARFNWMASCKAKAATAYTAALKYARTGIDLLDENSWQNQYELTLALHQVAVETAYLSGDFDQMETFANDVFNYAKTPLDRVSVIEVKIDALIALGKYADAIAVARDLLHQLGVEIPTATEENVAVAFESVSNAIGERLPSELLDLPENTDKNILSVARILTRVASAAYVSEPLLYTLIVLKKVYLSVVYGNEPTSTFGYVSYGILMCGAIKNFELGYEFGQLALTLLSRTQNLELKAKTLCLVNAFTQHWKVHLRKTLHPLQIAYSSGLDVGDLTFAGYSIYAYGFYSYFAGNNLTQLELEIAKYSQTLKQSEMYCQLLRQILLNLTGRADNPVIFKGIACDEEQQLSFYQAGGDCSGFAFFWIHKMVLCYLFSDFEQAVNHGKQARRYLDAIIGSMHPPIFHFYESLTYLALLPQRPAPEQQQMEECITANQEKLHEWAAHAPMNFQHKYELVEAERYRVLGQRVEAIEYYDRAITGAKEHEYLQEEGLANELAAKFYLDWGKEKVAACYLQEAYYCYARWGAKAKIADLETHYPQLLAPILQQTRSALSVNTTITVVSSSGIGSTTSTSTIADALDFAAILKAGQALSREIELDKLFSTLLQVVITNAGADKCVLLLSEEGCLIVQAVAKFDFCPILLNPHPLEESQDVPVSLINAVKRSLQPVVVVDATVDLQFIQDSYIQQQQPKSILCSPILHQGKLLGILYLENNLVTGAFTLARVELLNLICAQAAISLENARLYQKTLTYAQQLEQSLEQLNASQSRFHNLVDNVPGVVYQSRLTPDGDMALTYISADCYDLYEITPEEALSDLRRLMGLVHPEDTFSYQRSLLESIKTLTPWHWEGRIITPSGAVKWICGEARLEQQLDGCLVWDGLILEISDRKRVEAERQQKSLELEIALQELQHAQLQIVQNEKMSALGSLVAGVAHEINNPVGFIAGNLQPALDYIEDTFGLIDLYQQEYPNPSTVIQNKIAAIEFEYIREDLPKLIGSMKLGVQRIRDISTSLRIFSRADRDYKVPFHLHSGINSTILILKHRLKANDTRPAIEVVTDYGNIPEIECFPGQINQVFMNILANAIDAIEESFINGHGLPANSKIPTIAICTYLTRSSNVMPMTHDEEQLTHDRVVIQIQDNGIGMTEEVKQKMFDHLFTTKGVGKGTGLGLAIARQIVIEKHGGTIEVNSTLGEGTQFVITLPVKENS
ncbi:MULTISPECIES: trifunctional serine/threonine-protein kinase/ATP-binding protein/sensor histidine kinase [Nostocales]|uniref:histidine kinase n=3 Tax=Nostocales TaxID=1161 RepID=A0A0C1RDT6_9CYAN|nr:AAA family ATPase [Tolypothrix bouteillei]KAF3886376.1 AAA family ATPase [Tolypothrix bouteillei VB521301]